MIPMRFKTMVQQGGRIQLDAPELQAGDWVEVTVEAVNATVEPKITVAELIDSLQGHRSFQTAEEVDAYLREERNSWDD